MSPLLGNRVPVRRSTGFSSYRCWSRGASGFRILPVLIYTSCSLYLEFRIQNILNVNIGPQHELFQIEGLVYPDIQLGERF